MHKEIIKMRKRLTDASGVPGYESEVGEVIRKELSVSVSTRIQPIFTATPASSTSRIMIMQSV